MYRRLYRQYNLGQTGPDWVLDFRSPTETKHSVLEGTSYEGLIDWTVERVEEYNKAHQGSPYCWRLDESSDDDPSDAVSVTYEYRKDMHSSGYNNEAIDVAQAASDAAMAASAIHEASCNAIKHEVAKLTTSTIILRRDVVDMEKTIRATAVAFIIGFLLHAAALVVGYNILKGAP